MRLAEDVAVTGEAFSGDSRKHLVSHQPYVVFASAAILVWDLVRAEECRNQFKRRLGVQPLNHSEDLQLVVERQAIPALGFDCGCAVLEQAPYSPQSHLKE